MANMSRVMYILSLLIFVSRMTKIPQVNIRVDDQKDLLKNKFWKKEDSRRQGTDNEKAFTKRTLKSVILIQFKYTIKAWEEQTERIKTKTDIESQLEARNDVVTAFAIA